MSHLIANREKEEIAHGSKGLMREEMTDDHNLKSSHGVKNFIIEFKYFYLKNIHTTSFIKIIYKGVEWNF